MIFISRASYIPVVEEEEEEEQEHDQDIRFQDVVDPGRRGSRSFTPDRDSLHPGYRKRPHQSPAPDRDLTPFNLTPANILFGSFKAKVILKRLENTFLCKM